ncbi:putative aquaporin 2 [Lentinula novae-zelandiae]|nr:putative aquaporin 2 [Lentinula novae-zelandiae]
MSTNVVHLRDVQARSKFFTVWERHRHTTVHWLVECFAEFVGLCLAVFRIFVLKCMFYAVLPVLQIGLAYACGIIFAISICGATSGGHFNPAVTLTLVLFKGFPPFKAVRYIIAQILGGYIACLLIYVQWHDLIKESELVLAAAGTLDATLFTPQGPAGAFGLYVIPGLNLGGVFLNEFVTDIFLALVIWGSIDPTNVLIPPQLAPFVIALAYAAAIWGFATPALAANPARDLGGRLAAMTIWGTKGYIPATMLGVFIHELFLTDYARVIPSSQREYMEVHHNHAHAPGKAASDVSSNEKADLEHNT